ncbi:MAG: hypothetical protein JWL89_471 [Candidatus Saccharibacteria bacterium]|nr:hypothetical protein [Candidatus Saccharibacteria bacterium]
MIETKSRPSTIIENSYQAESVYLTEAGRDLLEESPEAIDSFLRASSLLASRCHPPAGRFEYVGAGSVGKIYGVPDHAGLCLKVATPRTIEGAWETGPWDSNIHIKPPDLLTEVRYMDAVKKHLDKRPEVLVTTPTQYGRVKFDYGTVSLQERIPSDYASIHDLGSKLEEKETFITEQGEIAINRTVRALGRSILRFGAGDMRKPSSRVNSGNFLIHSEQLADDSLIYVVDLVGFGFQRQALAKSVLKFA